MFDELEEGQVVTVKTQSGGECRCLPTVILSICGFKRSGVAVSYFSETTEAALRDSDVARAHTI